MADKYVYPFSVADARSRNELTLWRESRKLNIACKDAIEAAIRRDFDGMNLKGDCAESVIAEYGYTRVHRVLAATLQDKDFDGRFSRDNKAWAQSLYIPEARDGCGYIVESHPAVLDGFVNEYRRAYDALGLFEVKHCEPDNSQQDYEGKVIVLSPNTLREECWSRENQLWLCSGGFGSHPNSRGRAVFATCLGDDEQARWNRSDFCGVLKEEFLPVWAKEKLEQMNAPLEQSFGGQTM